MDRLNKLLDNYNNDTGMSIEVIDLLVTELNNRAITIKFLGEQLEKVKDLSK
jgi:hypothetical protein